MSGDTRVFDLSVPASSYHDKQGNLKFDWVKVGGVMERAKDGKLYALINKDINFAGFYVPEGKDCVLIKMFPVHGRKIEILNPENEKDTRVFNMKVRARSYQDDDGERINVWRKVGFIMRRGSDSHLYMLIHRFIDFGGYNTEDNKDSVFTHIFPVNGTEFQVIET